MGSCHINFMYVNSGIDKSLDVSISLTKQIPHKVQTEGLLCSYYPSIHQEQRRTGLDTFLNVRVLYLFEIPEEYAPKWEFLAKFYVTGYGSQ